MGANTGGRALLSVHDKRGIVAFARGLAALGWEIVSTGGTLATLRAAGVDAIAVSDVTGFPEIMDGRVKTLHPAIHGGLLARCDDPAHRRALVDHGIQPIDLLAVNLYPFETVASDPAVADDLAIENIDIGGPAMLRAAAKNHAAVIVVSDPAGYDRILAGLEGDGVTLATRRRLAASAFGHVATYDSLVARYLAPVGESDVWPDEITFAGRKASELRYGENPHQRAAAYRRLTPGAPARGVLDARQLSGKELSFNNLLDADAAIGVVAGIDGPAVAIVKHTIPCGLAARPSLIEAYEAALAGDPVSAFGGIVALNRPVDAATAAQMSEMFFDVIVAPAFADDAVALLGRKKQLRLLTLETGSAASPSAALDIRPIRGGLLVQEPDDAADDDAHWTVATERSPTTSEWANLRFAWRAVRHVKSNAIVLARDRAVVGVGAGQPSRLESVAIAVRRAGERANGAALASDAFFPFADGLDAALSAGVTAAIQPGGSRRDAEVIAAANAAGATMVFTGTRHFRH